MLQNYSLNVSGVYTFDKKKFTPIENPESSNNTGVKCLQVCNSKHPHRPQFIQAIVCGDAKPKFISSIYEPRTAKGLFNFEYNGLRYEVTPLDETLVRVYQLNANRKKVGSYV